MMTRKNNMSRNYEKTSFNELCVMRTLDPHGKFITTDYGIEICPTLPDTKKLRNEQTFTTTLSMDKSVALTNILKEANYVANKSCFRRIAVTTIEDGKVTTTYERAFIRLGEHAHYYEDEYPVTVYTMNKYSSEYNFDDFPIIKITRGSFKNKEENKKSK